jgi:membrane-associated phospholipid phosphatase
MQRVASVREFAGRRLSGVEARWGLFHAHWNEHYGWRAASALAALSASLLAFAYLVESYVDGEALSRLDARFNHWLHHEAWAPLVRFFELVTVPGNSIFLLAVTVTAVTVLLSRGDRPDAALISLAYVGSTALTFGLKLGFERPRPPFHDPDLTVSTFSFPSGHATSSLAVYGAFAIVVLRGAQGWKQYALVISALVMLLALIGFSRVYLGAHYFSDVLAGFSVGTAWLMICVLVLTVREARRRGRSARAVPSADF